MDVVAKGFEGEKDGQKVVIGKTATLELTPRQAETLALSRQLGSENFGRFFGTLGRIFPSEPKATVTTSATDFRLAATVRASPRRCFERSPTTA